MICQTISDYFTQNADRRPHQTAIVCSTHKLSYQQLEQAIQNIIGLLGDKLSSNNPAVAVCSENGFLYPAIAIAGSALGFTIVPVASSLKRDQLLKIFAIGQPDILITTGETIENFDDDTLTQSGVACHVNFASATDLGKWQISSIESSRGASIRQASGYVMNFTSGSTGHPKPVCVSEETKLNRILAGTAELFHVDHSDVILVSTPQYHSLGFRQSLVPLVLGGTGIVMKKFHAHGWLDSCSEHKVTFTIGVSSQFSHVADVLKNTHDAELNSLKTIVCSSAPFTAKQRQLCKKYFPCQIFECYGASEIGIASVAEVTNSSLNNQSVGFAPDYADIRILDPVKHTAMPLNDTGEIAVKSRLAFSGYYNNSDETAKATVDGYFLTGDLGYITDSNEVFYVGRHKEVIQNSGVTVYPSDIEMCCLDLNGVTEACALSVMDKSGAERVGLCVVADSHLSDDDILRYLLSKLSKWQIPRIIKRLDELPMTPIGKIDKQTAHVSLLEAISNS